MHAHIGQGFDPAGLRDGDVENLRHRVQNAEQPQRGRAARG
jgi:hypothetical protein